MPPGRFAANAAWLALAVLAHNLGRWTLKAAGPEWERATVAVPNEKQGGTPTTSSPTVATHAVAAAGWT